MRSANLVSTIQNYNYLILGSDRAVLFDAGPGWRDIRPVVESLTNLPVTFVPSHFHYDHVGNANSFDHVAVVNLPHVHERTSSDGLLQLNPGEHLGGFEGIAAPILKIDDWLEAGSTLQLGNRQLRVLYTPGHTEDSISLLDQESGYLFTGDFIYPAELVASVPGSSMGDYLQSAKTVLAAAPVDTRIFGAHRVQPGAPEVNLSDVRDLRSALTAIRGNTLEGEGFYPVVYPVNNRIDLWAEPSWLQTSESRYPELFE